MNAFINWLLGPQKPARQPSVLVNPVTRTDDMDWEAGRNWFGGRPAIGQTEWPRHPVDDKPLHMVAQINLEDLAACDLPFDFPTNGTLAFFCDTDLGSDRSDLLPGHQIGGRVVYSADDQAALAEPPADLAVPCHADWTFYFPIYRRMADVPRCFPRWRVDLMPVAFDPENLEKEYFEQVWPTKTGGHLTAHPPLPPREQVSWRVIKTIFDNFARRFETTHDRVFAGTSYEPLIEVYERKRKAWPDFDAVCLPIIARWEGYFAEIENLDTVPGPERRAELDRDLSALAVMMRETKESFQSDFATEFFVREDGVTPGLDNHWNFTDAMRATYLAMRTGSQDEYLNIPQDVRDFWQEPSPLNPYASAHFSQVLGPPQDIQDRPEETASKLLLLQLASEGPFLWGDVGYVKFWIDADDLAKGQFDDVIVTFEGH